jgi:hypothetical protein
MDSQDGGGGEREKERKRTSLRRIMPVNIEKLMENIVFKVEILWSFQA